MTTEPAEEQSSDEGADSPLIDGCYYLESCSFSKIANQKTVGKRDGERLVQANLIYSETFNAPTGFKGPKRNELIWDKGRSTVYAICSQARPIFMFKSDTSWMAEEFDFTMVPGVAQNNANIFQALCHGAFSNEVVREPEKFGYIPLEDGGRGQFPVNSPQGFFADKPK